MYILEIGGKQRRTTTGRVISSGGGLDYNNFSMGVEINFEQMKDDEVNVILKQRKEYIRETG